MFASENWIIGDNCEINVPCDLFIDAIENSVITVTDKEVSKQNSNNNSLFNRLAVLQKRIIMLMSSSAIERYQHFVETYPGIIQRVPQKMVASYLGITPEALSKVRGDKARTK
jgi:hypothetical protein